MKLRFAFLLGWVVFWAQPALAAGTVMFSVMVPQADLRRGPGSTYPSIQLVARGQTFIVTGRAPDNEWLRLEAAGGAWIKANLGRVQGELRSVPLINTFGAATVSPAAASPTPAISMTGPANPVVAAITVRARAIYQAGLALGNNPHAFSKVGDCQSTKPFFLAAFDAPGQYNLGSYTHLQETIDNFKGSFARESITAKNGLNTAGVLSPLWADPKRCQRGESALECEYRLHRPVIAILSLGTNGAWQSDAAYETSLRRIIEISIQRGVVPILSTKADNVEGGGRFNAIMANLAAEYDLPLWNFWLAVSALPNFGIVDDYRLSWGRPFFADPVSMSKGWAWRNLTALQSLDSVWKGVK